MERLGIFLRRYPSLACFTSLSSLVTLYYIFSIRKVKCNVHATVASFFSISISNTRINMFSKQTVNVLLCIMRILVQYMLAVI